MDSISAPNQNKKIIQMAKTSKRFSRLRKVHCVKMKRKIPTSGVAIGKKAWKKKRSIPSVTVASGKGRNLENSNHQRLPKILKPICIWNMNFNNATPRPTRFHKYWDRRYQISSLFDQGILIGPDDASWYSATPEPIAIKQAKRFQEVFCAIGTAGPTKLTVVIDPFCGLGFNSIQFARAGFSVIAIDIDEIKIERAKINAGIYQVANQIQFHVGDFMKIAPTLKGDAVFLSPPWGGPENCKKASVFDLRTMTIDGFTIFETARSITSNIGYYLPRNVNKEQQLAGNGPMHLQENRLKGKPRAVTAYFGELGRK